jgi:Family of unknown function (DUF6209)
MKTTTTALVALLLACGPNQASVADDTSATMGTNASALNQEVTLSFNRDWSISRSGGLVVGGTLRVTYDSQRLPQCRMEQGGNPLWAITGSWTLAGESGTFEAGGLSPSSHTAQPLIPLNRAGELQVWFQVTDSTGCTAWDSNFGGNYRFQIEAPGPTVRFLADWGMEQTASTVGARNVVFDYEPSRLPKCRQGYSGLPTWDILLYYRFDGGAVSYFPTTRVTGTTRLMNPVAIVAPVGARSLEVWFKANDRGGCVEWDSRFGQNYFFEL